MKNVMISTGCKAVLACFCVLALALAGLSGAVLGSMLCAGVFDGESYFAALTQDMMARDADNIMYNYFDAEDPAHPWESYHPGGIYTGEGSNLVYEIRNAATGEKALSTMPAGEQVINRADWGFSFEVSVPVSAEASPVPPAEDPYNYTLGSPVFSCAGRLYAYNGDSFEPVDESLTEYMDEYQEMSAGAMIAGFTYGGLHYAYVENGDLFVPEYNLDAMEQPEYQLARYTITTALRSGLPERDGYRTVWQMANMAQSLRMELLVGFLASLALGLALLAVLCLGVGRRAYMEEPVLSLGFLLPADLWIVIAGFLGLAGLSPAFEPLPERWGLHLSLILYSLDALFLSALFVYTVVLLAARIKTRTLVSGSLLGMVFRNSGRFFRFLGRTAGRVLGYFPLVWKVMGLYGALCCGVLLLMLLWNVDGEVVFLWFLEHLFGGAVILYVTLAFRRLKLGAEAIAGGDYTAVVREDHLVLDLKDTAGTLNHIRDGMNAAVEDRMRSERMKTELITNVSHDLKTPLTSIVSYVDLLKSELRTTRQVTETAEEYLCVLDRQSERLKKLIEDLVEASKASTGNLQLDLQPLDMTQLLSQAMGEYAQKLSAANLTVLQNLPEAPVMILADGRRLWRVFDNLLSNAVKYAMPGTRLYLTVDLSDRVTATFRNISREPLTGRPEELMERFVRGDESRHTEGSGLGLSIARSLTETMGGTFSLEVDGDLFKAVVSFPILRELPEAKG